MSEFLVSKFWEGISNEELNGCSCSSCGKKMLPPRMICPACNSTELVKIQCKGTGLLKTKTVIHVPLPRFQDKCPYEVGIVDLDEGVSISGMLLESPKIGQKVKAIYLEDGEKKLLAFKPA